MGFRELVEEEIKEANQELGKSIQAAYFAAMRNGYASGVEGEEVPGEPWTKKIVFSQLGISVVDQWTTSKAGGFVGWIRIWFDNCLIWEMRYKGLYDPKLIPILKRALSAAYQKGQFCGGRGDDFVDKETGGMYFNRHQGDITVFEGMEVIITPIGGIAKKGYCEYRGGIV